MTRATAEILCREMARFIPHLKWQDIYVEVEPPSQDGFAYYEEWSKLVERSDLEAKELLERCGCDCQHHINEKPEDERSQIRFKLFKETGKPGEVICKFAHDENAHLILMGSRGQGTLRRTFLGSNSDYCVHHAHIPVAVVPPPHEGEQQHVE